MPPLHVHGSRDPRAVENVRRWAAALPPAAAAELASLLAGRAPPSVVKDWIQDHGGSRRWSNHIGLAREASS